jgi:hypothetical protein
VDRDLAGCRRLTRPQIVVARQGARPAQPREARQRATNFCARLALSTSVVYTPMNRRPLSLEPLPILLVGDFVQPFALAEADGQMQHVASRFGAVPVFLAGRDVHDVAGRDHAPAAVT